MRHGSLRLHGCPSRSKARVTCVDWPNVLTYTRGYAERMGLADRVEYREGDIFSIDLGNDYDVVIMANIHHHFPAEECVRLNRRAKAALRSRGVAVVVDFIADDERRAESKALLFALVMMS